MLKNHEPPNPTGGAYGAPPKPLVGLGGGKLCPDISPSTPSACNRFVDFGDSSAMCPSQNNFLDPPLPILCPPIAFMHNKCSLYKT